MSYFFEKDIKIGDLKRRSKTEERVAKSRGPDKTFKGKLFVLVDSNSASAAEVFARVIQLEKRGIVVGDVTKGAVMTSVMASFAFKTPFAMVTPSSFYGANITVGDLIMVDGKSLENIGVTPDERLLPRGEDLAAKRDPVLAHAAELAGVVLDSAKAGTILQADPTTEEDDKSDQEPPSEIWFMD